MSKQLFQFEMRIAPTPCANVCTNVYKDASCDSGRIVAQVIVKKLNLASRLNDRAWACAESDHNNLHSHHNDHGVGDSMMVRSIDRRTAAAIRKLTVYGPALRQQRWPL
ncbi:MAG TPA: hypothetical protein VGN07_06155 [Steroidobacteraceae bacterium]|jgi:hypothetical protein